MMRRQRFEHPPAHKTAINDAVSRVFRVHTVAKHGKRSLVSSLPPGPDEPADAASNILENKSENWSKDAFVVKVVLRLSSFADLLLYDALFQSLPVKEGLCLAHRLNQRAVCRRGQPGVLLAG